MAQERPLTPEKQLLKLIEEPKAGIVGVGTHVIRHYGFSFFSFSAWAGRISFFQSRIIKWFRLGKYRQIDLKVINRFLGASVAVLLFIFLNNIFISLANLKKTHFGLETKGDIKIAGIPEVPVSTKTASYFLEKVRQRDIFSMGAQDESEAADAKSKGPTLGIIEATKHLRLVGISWSADPDAMIEDTTAVRTFFIKRGQMIGDVKVEAIFKDKIVLRYNKEEIELK